MSSEPAVSALPRAELVCEPHRSVSSFSVWKLAGWRLKQKRDLMSGQSGWMAKEFGFNSNLGSEVVCQEKGVLLWPVEPG